MKKKCRFSFAMVTAVLLSLSWATFAVAGPAELGVKFSWDGIRKCTAISPEIKITHIPEGTVSFRVKLKDLDVPDYHHGGGTVPNDGSGIIPKRALKYDTGLKDAYRGPCPPMGAHYYEFTVKALDSNGKVLAEGKAVEPLS